MVPLPPFPVIFGDLPIEEQRRGLSLLRELLREECPEVERVLPEALLAEAVANLDLRFFVGEEGREC